ncbi:unnamed protein product [Albugo candida]|uniref:Uncharacterized protein n=1 Tax=Albugo candida TaxID=65357 RepID=A0A024FWI5_9STRA|nr:unnamed protein product [Albugo candida]|eukprot:CCI11518.1 unnamed protein product [Albugo candida]
MPSTIAIISLFYISESIDRDFYIEWWRLDRGLIPVNSKRSMHSRSWPRVTTIEIFIARTELQERVYIDDKCFLERFGPTRLFCSKFLQQNCVGLSNENNAIREVFRVSQKIDFGEIMLLTTVTAFAIDD